MTRLLLLLSALFLALPGLAEAGGGPPAPVPEPMSMLLLGGGIAGLGIRAYRRRQ